MNLKLKKILLPRLARPESFQDMIWFVGYTPKEMEFLAAKNDFTAICYLPTTPMRAALFFHLKNKIEC